MYNECRHIFTSGKKCQSPALKDQTFCYFHSNTRKRPAPQDEAYEPYIAPQDTAHHLTPLEDADAIQLALSDVVLALAANRIDPRRARILIYGLQVASQNHRNRSAMAAKETAAAQTVREIQEYEDGTLIGPAKESPDPEEVAERKRPPSLGEILLREAEAMRAERIAKEEAAAAESEKHPISLNLPQIQAVADTPAAEQKVESPLHPSKAPKPREARKRLQVEAGDFSPRNKAVAAGGHLTAVGYSGSQRAILRVGVIERKQSRSDVLRITPLFRCIQKWKSMVATESDEMEIVSAALSSESPWHDGIFHRNR